MIKEIRRNEKKKERKNKWDVPKIEKKKNIK